MGWRFKFGGLRVLWLAALHFPSPLPSTVVCRLSFKGGHKEQRWLLGNLQLATKDEVHGDCQLPSIGVYASYRENQICTMPICFMTSVLLSSLTLSVADHVIMVVYNLLMGSSLLDFYLGQKRASHTFEISSGHPVQNRLNLLDKV
ncbi:uncharacterized protein [Triticum aestivum]|uniref:uncharacterized protein isoform X1 n=1 Tax=Triticum aestivum TaxID=4565 RepID=UPI001D033933|nr:uncharacterized protein LOC123060293 isoform X1 [Triticum aestivum]XP_044338860.1 uncharacterized protein LOC123060293 isoform X1 [Triticum aestivum]XP_044338861.1 uncharacterized protein LOC123060293 isoform X1 [Triticum aestivum]XP_044338862.1 uncharacterized protein LOC123060293 isoform X1 [Triticum aestivum]XP_044338863.1 uncharacterized protein LOC123060293 isoform X1 [Triticum aestivum]XP_044338864.1 uncharacterized protein LOC123060293 isoform X1 [Triticum aestivum]XP_044338865.1 un